MNITVNWHDCNVIHLVDRNYFSNQCMSGHGWLKLSAWGNALLYSHRKFVMRRPVGEKTNYQLGKFNENAFLALRHEQ